MGGPEMAKKKKKVEAVETTESEVTAPVETVEEPVIETEEVVEAGNEPDAINETETPITEEAPVAELEEPVVETSAPTVETSPEVTDRADKKRAKRTTEIEDASTIKIDNDLITFALDKPHCRRLGAIITDLINLNYDSNNPTDIKDRLYNAFSIFVSRTNQSEFNVVYDYMLSVAAKYPGRVFNHRHVNSTKTQLKDRQLAEYNMLLTIINRTANPSVRQREVGTIRWAVVFDAFKAHPQHSQTLVKLMRGFYDI